MMSSLQTYGTYDTSGLNSSIDNISTIIDDFTFAKRNDLLLDSTSLQWFQKIANRSEEHTSELPSQTLISYAVFCL